ncbi:DUF559 domain-containing protein [Dactylosporangium roseum]|uniref:DUF559 domain-containing protein n=1 Tax=Dactylosporangium roseum TaxID=47989 RepID=UPI0021B17BEB|nr:DUF559 domain-containing protein [Dactylosporangium roseum]
MNEALRTYRQILAGGVSRQRLRDRVASGVVAAVTRGVYGPPVGDEIDRIQAILMRLPEEVVLSHQSAAVLYRFAVPEDPSVHVLVPAGMPKPRLEGVVAHQAVVPVATVETVFGLRCAPPARVAIDLARSGRRLDGIALLDSALHSGLTDVEGLAEELPRHGGLRGVRLARELVPLADGGAECAQESHLRLVLIDGRLPVPQTQVWACTAQGRRVFRIDLAYADRKVGIEYDGASHLDRNALRGDRRRMNWLTAQGWTMRYFTAADVYRNPVGVVATVHDALHGR